MPSTRFPYGAIQAWREYEPEVDLYVSPCIGIELPDEEADELEVRLLGAVEERHDEVALGRKVVGEVPGADADLARDLGHGHGQEAALVPEPAGGLEDALAGVAHGLPGRGGRPRSAG